MLVSLQFTQHSGVLVAQKTKTHTRRELKRQPIGQITLRCPSRAGRAVWCDQNGPIMRTSIVADDILAVREPSWIYGQWSSAGGMTPKGRISLQFAALGQQVRFEQPPSREMANDHGRPGWHLRQAMYMPSWAVRSYRRVVDVRFEHLNDISEADALAEGFRPGVDKAGGIVSARTAFLRYWTDLNGIGGTVNNEMIAVIAFDPTPLSRPSA
jgi:hypothetical protein